MSIVVAIVGVIIPMTVVVASVFCIASHFDGCF